MLAPGQPFPSEGGVPTGDIDPVTSLGLKASSSALRTSSTPTSSTSSMPASAVPNDSHKLSSGAIAGIVIAGVFGLALFAALLFLLGRHTTLLQSMRRNQWPQLGPQNPPGNQEIGSPPPQMLGFSHRPGSPSTIQYSDIPSFHDHTYNSPPYSEHPSYGLPPTSTMAELSSGEKRSQEYQAENTDQHGNPGLVPGSPRSGPFNSWWSSKSSKTQYV